MKGRVTCAMGWVGGLSVLVLLAIANAAGYRYGVSDQAFYLPSILHDLDPRLYPRDAGLLEAQGQLMVTDEITAWLVRQSGVPLEVLCLAGHLASLVLLFVGVWLLARRMVTSRWTAAACCLAVTLRHRITETGANTFEGYYHPRGLAFALGVAATAALARDRLLAAWSLAAVAVVAHPTTGVWWSVVLGVATVVVRPAGWRFAAIGAAGASLVGVLLLTLTPFGARLHIMDAAWLRPLASKDYVFPTQWAPDVWLLNLLLPLVAIVAWRWRATLGLAARWEAGIAAGLAALTLIFVASLPFIDANVALAVQLQTSRVFWVVDLFAVIGLAWMLAEAPAGARRTPGPVRPVRPVWLAGVLLAATSARGTYVMLVEHPERRLVQVSLANTDWVRVGHWIATRSPADSHVLADPDHDWKFGHSVRLTARRDVLVEGVKDSAISLYDRDVATRVQGRIDAVGDFTAMDAPRARALARRYDLDVLVIDRDLPLPQLHRDGRFRVYRLQ